MDKVGKTQIEKRSLYPLKRNDVEHVKLIVLNSDLDAFKGISIFYNNPYFEEDIILN